MTYSKINLACGTKPEYKFPEPWLNVDVAPGCANVVCDITNLPNGWKGLYEEVYASHVLEHFPQDEIVTALEHWRDLLIPGGAIRLVVPDAKIVAQAILDGHDSKGRPALSFKETTPIMTQIYGWEYWKRDMLEPMRHWYLFSADTLGEAMNMAGFVDVQTYCREEDPSSQFGFNNDAAGPFSLFMKGIKR